MPFLLDTNMVSDLVRNPRGKVSEKVREVGEAQVATSIVVAAELRFGAEKRQSPRLSRQLKEILRALEVLPLEPPADVEYGRIRADLERRGEPIGANDLLIAAHALSLGHVLVTDNEREFARIDGLRHENWLR